MLYSVSAEGLKSFWPLDVAEYRRRGVDILRILALDWVCEKEL